MNILYATRELPERIGLKQFLYQEGHKVDVVHTFEALTLQYASKRYDLVLLDRMEGKPALETLRAMRFDSLFRDARVLVYGPPRDKTEVEDCGAAFTSEAPAHENEIRQAIRVAQTIALSGA